jgi:uncharacterized protein (DUF2164 family)
LQECSSTDQRLSNALFFNLLRDSLGRYFYQKGLSEYIHLAVQQKDGELSD